MKVQALRCPSCLDVVWSRSVHDWRTCSCYDIDLDRGCFIDGGREYLRYGWMGSAPEIFELEVADPTPSNRNPIEPDEQEYQEDKREPLVPDSKDLGIPDWNDQ